MTADLEGRLRDWADGILETTAHDLLLEAADALEQNVLRIRELEADRSEWANKANEIAFKLAAAEKVVEAAREVAEDYGGRLTGPEQNLVLALNALPEAYSDQVVSGTPEKPTYHNLTEATDAELLGSQGGRMTVQHSDGTVCMAGVWEQSAKLLQERAETAEAIIADLWDLIPPQEPSREFIRKAEALVAGLKNARSSVPK